MMAPAATHLGIELHLLASGPDSSAAQVIARTTIGDYRRVDDVLKFAEGLDAVTFDHEHVPTRHLDALAEKVAVRPGSAALRFAQDKAEMRARMRELGVACPAFAVADTSEALAAFGEEQGWPIIAKTSRGGYDGKGVWKLHDAQAAAAVLEAKPEVSAGE